jgi:diadenosine tetraphosphate (Ap4A) HIT family hydrolase
MRLSIYFLLLSFSAVQADFSSIHADVRGCLCDLASPETPQTRGCSLCIEAAKHPASEHVILVKDNDPTKPNRWLALPRAPFDGANPLARMSAAERAELWNAAIAKATELWGDSWAIAMNGDIARRQCHMHVHIGKLLEGKEPEAKSGDNSYFVDDAAQLPAIADGSGLWFHPAGRRLHVHVGEQVDETVLMR